MSVKASSILMLMVFSISSLAYADVYKNVDSKGNVTYSDRPTQSNSEIIRTSPGNTTNSTPRVTTNPAQARTNSTADPQAGSSTVNISPSPAQTQSGQNTNRSSSKSSTTAGSSSGGGGSSSGSGGSSSSSGGSTTKAGTTAPTTGAKTAAPAAANTTAGNTTTGNTTTGNTTTGNTTTGNTTTGNTTTGNTTTGNTTAGNTTAGNTTAGNTTAGGETITINFTGQNKVKWHPGHYLLVYPQGTQSDASFANYTNLVIKGVAETPGLQGIQKQYFWNKLEPSKGVYDFSEIRRDLTALRAVNKRLVISFQERSFIDGKNYAPTYLLTPEYGGGVYTFNNGKGINVNYWNVKVQDRLVALMKELGRQFNSHPNLEAINFEETSHSNNNAEWKTLYSTAYYSGMIRVAQAAKEAFPNTVVLQYINYADWNMPKIVREMGSSGIGVGGPDSSEKDVNLLSYSYEFIRNLAGTVPVGMAVQYLNYEFDNGKGPVNNPSIASIHAFDQNYLKANYIFWMRRTAETWNGSNYYQDVLNHLKTINWNKNPSGGLPTACPKVYESCIDD
ncbi:DUF4124 domain-containing protein [Methylobacillus pratensis]